MRTSKRLAGLVLALGLVTAACGGSGGSTGETSTAPTDPATDAVTDAETDAANPAVEPDAEGPLTIYSGRSEELVGEVFTRFTAATGIEVEVRYAGTSELAATILEEGGNSPADVYWAQDAGALGALARAGSLATLADDVLDLVEPQFRSPDGHWIGVTGRVRTVVWNKDNLTEAALPASVFDLTDAGWEGRVGWAPTNGSFQSFVTAMRRLHGDDATRQWVRDMLGNSVHEYPNNTSIVDAVGRGEIDLGMVNHYYLLRFLAEDPEFPAANLFLAEDVGGLVNVAGVGIVASTDQPAAADQLVRFLLADDIQNWFGSFTDELEYPLAVGQPSPPGLPSLASLHPPVIDLSDLDDLEGTLALLREEGALS